MSFNKEKPPIGNKRRKNIIKIPTPEIDRYAAASFWGKIRAKTLEPSRGGMGIKLKIARRRLICAIFESNQNMSGRNDPAPVSISPPDEKVIILIKKLAIMAIKIFVRGPDKETSAMSFRPSFRLNGSTGTGFAAPKITGEPEIIKRRGRRTLINGSMCFLGFRVSLPASLAVGSPSFSATNPCATS